MDKLLTLALEEGDWHSWQPGIDGKFLAAEDGAESYLLRFAPGAQLAAHTHPADEETLVMSGDLQIGDVALHAGDWHLAAAQSIHPAIHSPGGAVIFIRYGMARAQFSAAGGAHD